MRWAVAVALTAASGAALHYFQIPAAWVLGGIIGAGSVAVTSGAPLKPHTAVSGFGRGLVCLMAALPLLGVAPRALLPFALPALAITALTVGLGVAFAYLLHRVQPQISMDTSLLSTVPGGASMIAVMAEAAGADVGFVSLTQYLRMLVISLSLPVVTALVALPADAPGGADAQATHPEWWVIAVCCVIAFFGEKIGSLVRLPAPTILGPLLLMLAFGQLTGPFSPPETLQIITFAIIGWICGGGLDRASIVFFAKQLPAILGFICALLGLCALIAWPLVPVLGISYFEAYLATTPGALESVLAIAAETTTGPAVVSIQIIRLLCVLLLLSYSPQLIRWLARRSG